MLAALRTNTKIVLWFVVVAFVGFTFAVWGRGLQRSNTGAERGLVGRVEGVPITYSDFAEANRARLRAYAEQTGTEISEAASDAVREETWSTMVTDILIEAEMERLGIDVTNDHVFQVLWNNPPASLYESPAFQKEDGSFDFDAYHREIQMHPERWEGVAEMYRNSLRRQMLQQEIQSAAFVSDSEVWNEFVEQNEKVRVSYVSVDPRSIDRAQVMPTDDEARAYYDMHRAEYERPETVTLNYVEFPRVATAEDEEDIRLRLADLANAVRDGEEFSEIASSYSEGPSAAQGGDLGWFKRGVMDPEFEEVAFSLDVGEVSEPVKTSHGYHIIMVEDRRRTGGELEIKARHILARVAPSEETLVALEDNAAALEESAQGEGLAAAAAEAGYEVKTTEPFADGRYLPGIGVMRPAVRLAFESDAGTVYGPFVNADAYFVFEVAEKFPSRLPTYDEIAAEVEAAGREHPAKTALIQERQKDRARTQAQEIADAVASGHRLEEAIGTRTLQHTELFSRHDYVPGVGSQNAFIGTSFGIDVGQTSGVVQTESPFRYYVLRVEEKVAADQEAYVEVRDRLRQELMQREQMELFSAWLQGLMAKADIKDYRSMYF